MNITYSVKNCFACLIKMQMDFGRNDWNGSSDFENFAGEVWDVQTNEVLLPKVPMAERGIHVTPLAFTRHI